MVDCISPSISGGARSSVVMEHLEELSINLASESYSMRDVQPSLLGQRKVT